MGSQKNPRRAGTGWLSSCLLSHAQSLAVSSLGKRGLGAGSHKSTKSLMRIWVHTSTAAMKYPRKCLSWFSRDQLGTMIVPPKLAIHKATESFLADRRYELSFSFLELWLIFLSFKEFYVEEVPVCLWSRGPSPHHQTLRNKRKWQPLFFSFVNRSLVSPLHSVRNYVSLPLSKSHPLCSKACKIITWFIKYCRTLVSIGNMLKIFKYSLKLQI